LCAHVAHWARTHLPDEKGITKARQWALFAQRTGKRHPDLDGPEPHPAARYIMDWWRELHRARAAGAGGPAPIGFVDIDAWARLTGRRPTALEIAGIRAMDDAFLSAVGDELAKRREIQAAKEKRT